MASAPYTCVPTGYLEPKIGETGAAAWPATTVPKQFRETVAKFSTRPAMGLKRRPLGADVSASARRIHPRLFSAGNICSCANNACPKVFSSSSTYSMRLSRNSRPSLLILNPFIYPQTPSCTASTAQVRPSQGLPNLDVETVLRRLRGLCQDADPPQD